MSHQHPALHLFTYIKSLAAKENMSYFITFPWQWGCGMEEDRRRLKEDKVSWKRVHLENKIK
jgi:hypothetical protein